MLAVKGINHSRVNVSVVPPRPELKALGVDYRRIPVVAIGKDIYCDTLMISLALERRLPQTASIFPPRKDGGAKDAALMKLLSFFYADR